MATMRIFLYIQSVVRVVLRISRYPHRMNTMVRYALNYCENGYYNAKIFIQNELDDYTSYFEDAVDAWNNAGVIDREVVVNTSSSSYIHNCSFSDSNSYWEEYYSNAHGTYYATSTLSYACSCHNDFWEPHRNEF